MKPAAVLLIDFENFYHSRRDYFRDANLAVGQQPELADDLAALVRLAERMTELPLAVRRAYANFNLIPGAPRELMHRGIEPVQVFCLTEAQNKNAADMRMAMDAVALAGSGAPFEHFVLVTGDSDFIPVILELKSRGHAVSVIAVTGSAGSLIRRFADKFKRFEDVVVKPKTALRVRPAVPAAVVTAATSVAVVSGTEAEPSNGAPVVPAGPDELPRIAAALKRVLSRVRPVRVNAIHRELSKELGYSFDPAVFACNSTGAFVRRNAAALGVVVRGSQNEQQIDFLVGPAPSANGSHAAKGPAPRAVPAQPPEPHTAAHYKEMLGKGHSNENIVSAVPWSALVAVCDAVVPVLAPPTGGPTQSLALLSRLKAAGAPDDARLMVSALRCALPRPADGGVYSLPADSTGEQIRARLLNYIGYVLRTRLTDNRVEGPVRPEVLAAVFDPGPALEQARQEFEAALAEPVAEPAPPDPAPAPAPVRTSARVEAVHTPAGYRDLLKSGGQEGSTEPEHQSINPPPWTSFDRVCSDTFAALSAPADGGLTPDQLQEQLCAAGADLPIPNYRAHVRRAFAILKLSNAVLEQDGRVALHPQVTDPNDIRWAVLGVMLTVLALRLRDRNIPGPVRPDVFLAAIAAGPLTDELAPQVAQAVEGIERNFAEPGAAPDAPDAPQGEVPSEGVLEGDQVPVVQPEFTETQPAVVASVVLEVTVAEVAAPELEPVRVSDEWTDPYSFDGELPEFAPTAPPEQARADDTSETSSSGVLDVAALTRTAMEHPTEPVVAVVSVETISVSAFAEQAPEPVAQPERSSAPAEVRSDVCAVSEVAPEAPTEPAPIEPAAPESCLSSGCGAGVPPAFSSAGGTPAPQTETLPAPAVSEEAPNAAGSAALEPPVADEPPAPPVPVAEVTPPPAPEAAPQPEDDIPLADLVLEDEPCFWNRPATAPTATANGFHAPAEPPPVPAETEHRVPTITHQPPEFRPPESA